MPEHSLSNQPPSLNEILADEQRRLEAHHASNRGSAARPSPFAPTQPTVTPPLVDIFDAQLEQLAHIRSSIELVVGSERITANDICQELVDALSSIRRASACLGRAKRWSSSKADASDRWTCKCGHSFGPLVVMCTDCRASRKEASNG